MRIVVPKVTVLNAEGYRVCIAHYPLQDSGEWVERIRSTMRISSCSSPIPCYSLIYGGVILFEGEKPVWRGEFNGYFTLTEETCNDSLEQFLTKVDRGEDTCLKVSEGTLKLLRKCQSCTRVDPIGLRMIVD
ncbi:hypothetical protein HA72_0630 [Metallosphaera sedula]|uniref:Uncharacterized protein n=3 Tax=Metallosphaera TaxID=41980 RepID=A4YEF3_METS5|nr:MULTISPECIES: hypothetical protein [Metallosphaera]ABP94805.1 hypothetical protein Msed_0630 [Metallosphaera sedula DSM 5348]AIM26792.1 hypothetical protein HA72_0630 [Metallosphaera sedula]AKV73745.1 hypothetical protein MsedA_0643 [Metallosphaera sedula]AKV75985.1 hypothetical protein MsedB_0643 [Metallosphaera sedula]AKV78236.1 hypothetical protein MsedC_0642 [Metallosphaera sedula]